MKKKVLLVGFVVGFLMIPFLSSAEIYKWVDGNGTIHFTDDYGNIPSSYRERLKVETRKELREEEGVLRPQRTIPEIKEGQSKAAPNGEEAWQEEKMRSSMEALEEAIANYENAQRVFLEKAEELSRRRFGSATQYKFDILRLNLLNAERMKFRAKVEEADEIVRKLSKADIWEAASILGTEKERDIYGMGEEWWRDRVRPWKEKLQELEVRYENAEKIFVERAEDLSRRGYGNRHTIKAKIIELDWANQDALKYRSQIGENEEVLERISKDAEESGADPDWLK